MTLEWSNWRIQSYDRGYQIQRKLKGGRWLTESYHPELAQAVESLFKYRIRTETGNVIVRLDDPASARSSTAKLIQTIEALATELQEGLK